MLGVQVFMMSCCSKEKIDSNNKSKASINETNNLCKSHTTVKLDREMYRICPSKLSKRELEDLYFTLLESNLDLKKTINGQHDKIRVLSTQVHRMSSVQEKMMSKESKECCLGTKAIVNEQKDFISDLKEKNQHMAERIEQLNMRLCSAKQFLKSNAPHTSTGKPMRYPAKHDCLKLNEPVTRTTSSSQWEDSTPKKNAQTQVDVLLEENRHSDSDQPCNENRCRSLMDDLKIKIATLQEELSNVHNEYSTRISRLESEVAKVRKENIRVSSEFTASEHELHSHSKRTSDAMASYRNAEAKCAHLTAELAIERRKVAELEAQLKASSATHKVQKAIEDHLSTIRIGNSKCLKCCFMDENADTGSPPNKNSNSGLERRQSSSGEVICGCDDSGYQDDSQMIETPAQQIGNQKLMRYENDDPYKPETKMTCCEKQMFEKQQFMPRKLVNPQVLGNPQEAGPSMAAARPSTDDTRAETIELADGTQQIIDRDTPNGANNQFRNLVENARDRNIINSPNKLQIVEKTKLDFEKNSNNEHLKMAMTDKLSPGFNPEKIKYLEAEGVIQSSGVDLPEIKEKLESLTVSSISKNLPSKPPATEALTANNPTASNNQPPNKKKGKGACEGGCAGCTECEINNEHTINPYANNELPLGIQKEQTKKHDQHNSLQIPGPIPLLDRNKKENTNRHKFSKPRKDTGPPKVLLPRSATDGTINLPDVPQLHNREVSFNDLHTAKDTTKVDNKPLTQDSALDDDVDPSLVGVLIHIDSTQSHPIVPVLPAPANREQTTQVDRAQITHRNSTNVAQNTDQKLPEASSQVPATESAWQSHMDPVHKRDAAVYRRRSITPGVRTVLPQDDPPACDYDNQQNGCCANGHRDKGIQAHGCEEVKHPRFLRHAHSAPQRGTYTIDLKLTATSPDNTDLEMSCLSDLPYEKEKKCTFKQRPLSPGEDRTTTYSSSYSAPTTYSLSEGEMPAATTSKRRSVQGSDRDGQFTAASRLESPPAQQMEEALQAIADELKRCKTLLHSYRPAEVTRMPTVLL